jgi:REP element-mobilizing transposase RayT
MAKAHLTPDGWRCEKLREHLYRARWMDYQSPSIQMLTLVTVDRKPLLAELKGETISLTPLGAAVAREIERIPTYLGAASIEILDYVVMPDHVHILLRIHDRLPRHLGQYIRWFKVQCSDAFTAIVEKAREVITRAGVARGEVARGEVARGDTREGNNTTGSTSATASGWTSREEAGRVLAGVSASMVSPKSKNLLLFAHEYHDSLLYGRGQLARMKRYIKENPRRLALKRANRELFRIRQDYTIGRFSCTVLGNIFLAGHPQRQVLQCSRSLTPEQIEERRSECLMQAANGAVFITAAISQGEKVIARSLREHGFPLIILLEQGFPKPESSHYHYFKPQGVYFEACAAGRLLLVEPHAEALERPEVAQRVIAKTGNIPHTTQRYRFVAMNVIADVMCGDDTLA